MNENYLHLFHVQHFVTGIFAILFKAVVLITVNFKNLRFHYTMSTNKMQH